MLRIIELKRPNTFFGSVFWIGVQKGEVWWFLRFNKKCPRRSACFVDISSQEKFCCWDNLKYSPPLSSCNKTCCECYNLNARRLHFFPAVFWEGLARTSPKWICMKEEWTYLFYLLLKSYEVAKNELPFYSKKMKCEIMNFRFTQKKWSAK